jgi:hypothetical protein
MKAGMGIDGIAFWLPERDDVVVSTNSKLLDD